MSGVATTCRELLVPADLDGCRSPRTMQCPTGCMHDGGVINHSVKWLCSEPAWLLHRRCLIGSNLGDYSYRTIHMQVSLISPGPDSNAECIYYAGGS
jgi:hypothetical protein